MYGGVKKGQGGMPFYSALEETLLFLFLGLTVEQVKRSGGLSGVSPLPRDLNYPVMNGERWHDIYDMIRFPSEVTNKPHDVLESAGSKPITKGILYAFVASILY